jgi:hypothetical protein
MDSVTKVALAIVTVALVAVVVVNGANTAKVVNSATTGFANSISAAQKG